jgi:hypothetical protein
MKRGGEQGGPPRLALHQRAERLIDILSQLVDLTINVAGDMGELHALCQAARQQLISLRANLDGLESVEKRDELHTHPALALDRHTYLKAIVTVEVECQGPLCAKLHQVSGILKQVPGQADLAHTLEQIREQIQALIGSVVQEVRELLRKELDFVDHECGRTSRRPLEDLLPNHNRSFEIWEPTAEEISETRIHRTDHGKPWTSVLEQLEDRGAVVMLGDPGFGKTALLLQEVRERCQKALVDIADRERENAHLDDLTFGIYFHANRLANSLADTEEPVFECIVRLLGERHQPVSEQLKTWLLQKLERGQVLLAVDALDEVSQSREISMRDRLGALARESTPCPLLFSVRRISYTTAPVTFAAEWQLLPFTPSQLRQAAWKKLMRPIYSCTAHYWSSWRPLISPIELNARPLTLTPLLQLDISSAIQMHTSCSGCWQENY